ncbi:MAG: glycerol-3-phosphate dehydrogenase/oxidase [Candidatus Brocadiae bacterium]|nr:glycerol-3-phosphate dehydrogenase/oxidase [Candidatus Brocadiia bacterium]
MNARADILQAIQDAPEVPVLILGGGINGVGLYRELALQGVRCVLVDKADFAAGATSKSSRMIHGGLRYLESREFKLVRESLAERNRLIDSAPHYVSPLKTTIPLFSWLGGLVRSSLIFCGFDVRPGGRGALICTLGLTFYDFVTRKHRRTPRHYLTLRKKSLARVPGLHPGIVATATYWDAQITEAERLCIELLQDAQAAAPDCQALNYVQTVGVRDGAVVLCDDLGGHEFAVRPQVVVNATGAWVDKANAALGLDTEFMGGTKGSHLMVDNAELRNALGDSMVYYEHTDGRVCITYPFADKVMMGSTDIRIDDPDAAACDSGEIEYMLATLRDVFPDITIHRDDIVFVFCGVRPLPSSHGNVTATISRGHSIRTLEPTAERPFAIDCLIGGKWTTFRAFAEQVADKLLAQLGRERRCATDLLPIGGGRDYPHSSGEKAAWVQRVAKESGLTDERVRALFQRYGTSAGAYAASVGAAGETPLATLPDYAAEEVQRIAADEWLVHLTDLVCRRSLIAIRGCASDAVLAELADVVGDALGWDAARKEEETKQAQAEVAVPALQS